MYELLAAKDLCAYYQIDRNVGATDSNRGPGVSMRSTNYSNDLYRGLDEPECQRHLLSFASSTRNRVVWTVPSMHCASCVWLLEQLDRFDAGIWSSSVEIMRKSVTVDYDPRATSLRSIAQTMAQIGYAPLVRMSERGSHFLGALDANEEAQRATRGLYARLGIAGFAAGNTMMLYLARYFAGNAGLFSVGPGVGNSLAHAFNLLAIGLALPVFLFCAWPWWQGVRTAIRRRRITLEVPVAIGIAVLFLRSVLDIGSGASEGYLDSFTGLVFFLLIGRLFQQKAFDALSFDRTYRSFFPLSVRVVREGEECVMPIDGVEIGDRLFVRNAEVVPCDSLLESSVGYIDYSFVTGESVPVECLDGSVVYAGGRVVGPALRLVAIKNVSHSELAAMWDKSSDGKNQSRMGHRRDYASTDGARTPRTQLLDLSDRFAEWFTGVAIVLAVGAAFLSVVGITGESGNWTHAFSVLTAVLIIACPCALTLATPITLGTAMGRLGRVGIYLKNIGVLVGLDTIDTVFFDKTGTLTVPQYAVRFEGRSLSLREVQAVRAMASQSTHPMSRAIADSDWDSTYAWRDDEGSDADDANDLHIALHEFPGRGIVGRVNGRAIAIGSFELLNEQYGLDYSDGDRLDIATRVAIDGEYAGSFLMQPSLRSGIAEAMEMLRDNKAIRLISGDTPRDRARMSTMFADDEMMFDRRPEEKIAAIERAQQEGHNVLMVGDGLNDAGAMSMANIAIAVTDDTATLVPACDVIMRAATLPMLPALLQYARRMKWAIAASLTFSIVYNVVGILLAAAGLLSPLVAAVFMPLSSIIVIAVSVGSARIASRRFTGRRIAAHGSGKIEGGTAWV